MHRESARRTPSGLRVYLRFVRYLLWEFRWPLVVFAALVFGGGLILHLSTARARSACPGPSTPSS